MIDTIWAPWLMREARYCRVWPARGPPGPPPGAGTGKVWVRSEWGRGRLSSQPLAAWKAWQGAWAGQGWPTVVRSIALIVSVYGAPELPRALPATAATIRSKPPLAGALGASSATLLPL